MLRVIAPFYNAAAYLPRCIASIQSQSITEWSCHLVDDVSTDGSAELAASLVSTDPRFTLIRNTSKRYGIGNLDQVLQKAEIADDDIVIAIDGDDWLAHDDAFAIVRAAYRDPQVWITYGQFAQLTHRGLEPGWAAPPLMSDLRRPDAMFTTTQLRTWRAFLWRHLRHADLLGPGGEYWETSGDQAFMLPMLEMAGAARSKFLPDVTYIYNRVNALNDDQRAPERQTLYRNVIRNKTPYPLLERDPAGEAPPVGVVPLAAHDGGQGALISFCTFFMSDERTPERREALIGLVRSLNALGPERFELVFVDYGARPSARDVLGEAVFPVKHVAIAEPLNRSRARNIAADHSRGELLFFLDADVTVPADLCQRIRSYVTPSRAYWPHVQMKGPGRSDAPPRLAHGGGVCGLTRNDFLALGGWNEELGVTWGGEDLEMYDRTQKRLRVVRDLPGLLHAWHPTTLAYVDAFAPDARAAVASPWKRERERVARDEALEPGPARDVPLVPFDLRIPSDARQYCARAVQRFSLGGSDELLHSRSANAVGEAPAAVATLLAGWRSFAPKDYVLERWLSRHVRREETASALAESVDSLVDAGFLIEKREWIERVAAAAPVPAERREPIRCFGIATRDRVFSLERALRSFIENNRRFGRAVEYVVIDDSPAKAEREACRDMLRQLQRRYAVSFSYGGAEERLHFAEELVRETGVSREVVRFALFDDLKAPALPYGTSRNALHLFCIDEPFLRADDDMVCRLARSPEASASPLNLGDAGADSWFFEDVAALERSVPFEDVDVLTIHEELLGNSVAASLGARTPNEITCHGADTTLVERMLRTPGRVVATSGGVVGDSAMGSPALFYLCARGRSRERLLGSRATYEKARASRQILRLAAQSNIYAGPYWMDGFSAYDNRHDLPPFFPVGRNMDGIFGLTVASCRPGDYLAQVPWAIRHLPPEERVGRPEDLLESARNRVRISTVVLSLIARFHAEPWTLGREGLRDLGAHLRRCERLDTHEFAGVLFDAILPWAAGEIATLEATLSEYGRSPDYWASDVEAFLRTARELVTNDELVLPCDLRGPGRSPDAILQDTQGLVSKFGALLESWPALLAGTRTLKARGIRPASLLGT